MTAPEFRERRWTRAEYDRLIDAGVFQPGESIELLGGLLVVAEPQGGAHFTAIRLAEDAFRAAFGPDWEVRAQGPIALDSVASVADGGADAVEVFVDVIDQNAFDDLLGAHGISPLCGFRDPEACMRIAAAGGRR
jgi:hypothetical protein